MRRFQIVFITFFIVVLFFGADIKNAVNHPQMSKSEENSPLRSSEDLLRSVLAEFGPPKVPVSLKELVTELQLVTPLANRTDCDGDGLWDVIESVIGTDFNDTDSDRDTLNDTFEVFNDLDPLAADSNEDDIPDNHEVMNVNSLDVDNDGIPNAWDFDNDNDGVSDAVDISPNAKSSIHDAFDIDIATDGKPLYISFQIIPDNPQHARLLEQWWDWPNDAKDRMQDLDGSQRDVQVLPFLNLTIDFCIDANLFEGYPMIATSNGLLLALNSVYDSGNIVALESRMYIPKMASTNLSMHAELIWKVVGQTDKKAIALIDEEGVYISSSFGDLAVANTTDILSACPIQKIDLGDGKIALKEIGGGFLSVSTGGSMYFNGTEVGPREILQSCAISSDQITLQSIATGLYVATSANGQLIANSTYEEVFQIADLGIYPEPITLEIYDDSFMFSGISIQECYYSSMGVYYSDNRNQTIAAQGLLTYHFLRNSTTSLWDIPRVLAEDEICLMYQNQSYLGVDHAYVSLSNSILPAALDSLPALKVLPVIIAAEHEIKVVDLSEIIEGSYVAEQLLHFDMDLYNTSIVKSLSCYFYNTTTYETLSIEQITDVIQSWGYDETTTNALILMIYKFSVGESIIDHGKFTNELPDISIVDSWVLFAKGVIGTFGDEILLMTPKLLRSLLDKHFIWPKTRPRSNAIWSSVASSSKAATTVQKVSKFLKSNAIAILCIVIDVGLSIYAAFLIAQQIGGRLGKEIGATYGTISSAISLAIGIPLLFLAAAGPVGFGIAAIISLVLMVAELLGGAISKLVEWLTETIFGSRDEIASTTPSAALSNLAFELSDATLSVGDRITLFCNVIGDITGSGAEQQRWVGESYNIPRINIDQPSGSNSITGVSGTEDYTLLKNTLYGLVPGDYWEARMYNYSAWIEPGIASPNFPVAIRMHLNYHIWDIWSHDVLGLFECRHNDDYYDSIDYEYTRVYFDVMPDSLNAFIEWRSIQALDSYIVYDSDCDELGDAFEANLGTNARKSDSDGDGLSDYYEYIYGTNATNTDSDGDGLFDYLEVAGWQIGFDYMANSSNHFEMLVTSDPCMNDSDGDAVSDLDEYHSHTNPRSDDTNGDGRCDEVLPRIESHPTLEELIEVPIGYYSLATDNHGYLYSGTDHLAPSFQGIKRYYTNLTEAQLPELSYFNELDLAWRSGGFAIDDANDWIYVLNATEAPGSYDTVIQRYSLDGTILNPDSWTPFSSEWFFDVDIGADSSIYTTEDPYVRKYDSAGNLLASWEVPGRDYSWDRPYRIEVDDANGLLYVACCWVDDIVLGYIIRMSAIDGSYLGRIPMTEFYDMHEFTVDDDGYLYALGWEDNPDRKYLCKFDRNGLEDMNFRMNLTDVIEEPRENAICIDLEKNVYITSSNYSSGEHIIIKLSQEITSVDPCLTDDNPDWDGDGLTNQQEVAGWEITVAFNATCTMTFNVTSDPRLSDTDGDHLSDYLEYNLTSNPQCPDSDADGVSDHQEWWIGLYPDEEYIAPTIHPQYLAPRIGVPSTGMVSTMSLTHWDSDGDSLGDGVELAFGSDPTLPDSDGDTLSDLLEFQLNSDPNKIDTDDDVATDAEEYAGNSSLLVADSDGDFAFDGAEYDTGTSPLNADVDGDGIVDGDEALFGTNPFSSDSDGDNVSDWLEIQLWLNPLNNDTDGDGVLDGVELEWGSNPWSSDSDRDGVPDSEDPDTFSTWSGPIILAYDPDEQNNTLFFAQKLQEYANVITVSVEELKESYTVYPYIVLVGRPDAGSETVAGLTYSLLEDAGAVLGEMMEPESHEVATRHGYWADPQTIVILSEAYTTDVYSVLQILRGRNISVLPDSVFLEYQVPVITDSDTYAYAFAVNEIDTMKATDTILTIALSGLSLPTLSMQRYTTNTTPYQLASDTGLAENEVPMGKYVEIILGFNGETSGTLQSALIQIYYRTSDLDFNHDGSIDLIGDLNETSLCLYCYDEESAIWVKLSDDLEWVIDWGVNTTDVVLHGEHYAGYIWAHVTHLSLYALAGELVGFTFGYPDLTLLVILFGFLGIGAVLIIHRKRKRQSYVSQFHLLDELQG